MADEGWPFDKVCKICRLVLADELLDELRDSQPSQAKEIDNFQELHGSIEHYFTSALDGCIVCAVLTRITREAISLHGHLVKLAESTTFMLGDMVESYIMNCSLEDRNKKREPSRGDALKSGETAELSHLDRMDESLTPSGSYEVEKDLSICRAHGEEPKVRVKVGVSMYGAELSGNGTSTFEITIHVRSGLVSIQDDIYVVDWVDSDEYGSISAEQSYTGSPETLGLIQHWLNMCERTHISCSTAAEELWYPTRLLKLEGTTAYLTTCDQERPRSPYATLSHCWGDYNFTTLSASTYAAFASGFPIAAFPATFRDAMTVCQSLGLSYIWIDSFCILQGDDKESRSDWENESRRMDMVYANGFINIAASHARSPNEGCFIERGKKNPRHVLIEQAPGNGGITRKLKIMQFDGINVDDICREGQEPLTTRGWCVQEQVLCRRMVTFNGDGVRWQCAHCPMATETLPTFHLDDLRSSSFNLSPGRLANPREGIDEPVRYWHVLLEAYTSRSLSQPGKDKLRAIEGVAQRFEQHFDDRYILGHFWQQFPTSLCWHSFCDATLGRRMLPSWTWASLDGRLSFPYGSSNYDNSRFHSMAAMVYPQTAADLNGRTHITSTLMFVGRILQAHILEPVADGKRQDYCTRVGAADWSVHAIFDVESERRKIWNEGLQFYLFPLGYWSKSYMSHSMLIVYPRPDGSFIRLGAADYWSREYMEPYNRDEPSWVKQWKRVKPSLVMLR